MQELFDLPEQYDAMLQKGISATGNDKQFFLLGRLRHVLEKTSGLDSVLRVLDYGCGTGETSMELSYLFPDAEIVGSDLSADAIHYASKKYQRKNLRFVPLQELGKNQFDLIYLNGVIHHIPVDQRLKAVRELFALSRSGTKIWIFENNPNNPGTQWAMYANPFDKGVVRISSSKLKTLLTEAGFEIIQTDFIFYFPQWLSWLRPLEKSLMKIPFGGQFGILAQKP